MAKVDIDYIWHTGGIVMTVREDAGLSWLVWVSVAVLLGVVTAANVRQALHESPLLADATMVAVAQRVSSIMDAVQILVMEAPR
ncbi:lipid A export ATP-binding/permease protein [Corynebacterium striatum]|uniref:Uncharacterized protein n=1 Tax=Corynebacterium striatum TaxID=43770 RepID=A0AAQ1TXS5_CORST|nr:hypothetical protein [Corynebacterium striatum]EEI77599.1 hypothetical protein HMPREF0308_2123 [Corynebacterium striatum ATCC 6940]QQE54458.1 hypothetical protein I6I11_07440 [Corynebacterium striatum]STD63047.1 lipid A export ATP-binding/permease protein [Corynebacterium striatum]GEA42022.1 hypothetical protein Cst04h_01920 [Corynebacterium striatum]GEA44587.1 hypothetical protein Cst04h_27570 [Corynebacterium striatum]